MELKNKDYKGVWGTTYSDIDENYTTPIYWAYIINERKRQEDIEIGEQSSMISKNYVIDAIATMNEKLFWEFMYRFYKKPKEKEIDS